MTKTAAIYARYSTDKQDSRSLDDQVRRCRKLADDRGYEVEAVYQDAAISGTTTDRVNLQKMLKDARRKDFDIVLVDDLSRLSRDLGDTWQLIFGDLAVCGVHVVDGSTGRSSNDPGARLEIGVKALLNDQYIEQIRRQTHRGLEGRALAGFATGGKTYGFKTVHEPNPPNPEKVRKLRVN
jgi:DNA invertase Pin-like site-specific DNA recombinase